MTDLFRNELAARDETPRLWCRRRQRSPASGYVPPSVAIVVPG